MNNQKGGRMARHLKNEAKKLSRFTGLPYHQCLNKLSKDAGSNSYNDFVKKNDLTTPSGQAKAKREIIIPKPLTLPYYSLGPGKPSKRPNAKVSVKKHLQLGKLLKELYQATEYNKRARKAIRAVRSLLDDWVQCEYVGQGELTDEVFFQMYYGDIEFPVYISPTPNQKAALIKRCFKVKGILGRTYHECKPVKELRTKLDVAISAIRSWPVLKRDKHKGVFEKRLIPGTLIYLKGNKTPLIALNHSFKDGTVTAYGDSGPITAARYEVAVFRDQSRAESFRPMRLYLPYGKWICSDGTQVLYNRDYCPLWVKGPDGKVASIDADYWIDYKKDEYYFEGSQAPWYGVKTKKYMERCIAELQTWGVEHEVSELMKRLPTAIADGDASMLKPKNLNKLYK